MKSNGKMTATFRTVCKAGEKLVNGDANAWRDDYGDWSELGNDALDFIDDMRRAYGDNGDYFSIGADW